MLMEAIIGGLLIGLCLGLLGSGGSILTVPLLVYLLEHDPKAAIGESLAIVGGIALLAAIRPIIQRRIDWPSVLLFRLTTYLCSIHWGSASGRPGLSVRRCRPWCGRSKNSPTKGAPRAS